MKGKKKPIIVQVSDQQLEQLEKNLDENKLDKSEKDILLAILKAHYYLAKLYRAKKLTLTRVKRLFSFKTEKNSSGRSRGKGKGNGGRNKNGDGGGGEDGDGGGCKDEDGGAGKDGDGGANNDNSALDDDTKGPTCDGGLNNNGSEGNNDSSSGGSTEDTSPTGSSDPGKENEDNSSSRAKGGHPEGTGCNGKDDFKEAENFNHELGWLKNGSPCPECSIGKVYPVAPAVQIEFTGSPPVKVTVHELQRLRCNACGKYFTADLPGENKKKYHPSVDVAVAMQKYILGLPFYRMSKWQEDLGIPLPASTQWERCRALGKSIFPVFQALMTMGAEGDLFWADDTGNKILDVQREIREKGEKRKGIFTTGIISQVRGRMVNLFFTGRSYSGENLDTLLKERKSTKKAILMSDALPRNLPKMARDFLEWANCLIHGRRNFWDLRDDYPLMVKYVIFLFSMVYKNEAYTKKKMMTVQQRLEYHQKHSGKIMQKIRRWGLKNLALKKIEPNEELGQALNYFFKHYNELTLFLREPGVPLDNNIVERLLKLPILCRKNSYFYKTKTGAFVGDMIMSVVSTCKSAGVNSFKYLQALHENEKYVKENPQGWLPWNYTENLSVTNL